MHAEPCAHALQGAGAVGGAIVDHQFDWATALEQRLLEHALDVERRFAQAEQLVALIASTGGA